MNRQHAIAAALTQRLGRYRMRQHAIHQETAVDIDRQEHSRIGTTGPNRRDQRSGAEYNAVARGIVGGGDRQRNAQFLEGLDLQNLVEKTLNALVGGKAEAGNRPAGEVAEAYPAADARHFRRGGAATVQRADQRAYAGTRNAGYRDVFFFEDLQNPDMGDAACESATEGNTNCGLDGPERRRGRG